MPSRFEVRVVPRSSRSGPDGRIGDVPRLRVKAPPADGKANAEVQRLCSELLGARARVVAGWSSRTKLLEVDLGPAELTAVLDRVFGVT